MWRVMLIVGMLGAGTAPPSAWAQDATTPEAFAARYAEIAKAGDWDTYARLMHPEALSALKKIFAEVVWTARGAEVVQKLFGLKTAQEFDALEPAEVFSRLFARLEKSMPQFKAAAQNMDVTVVGSVPEGPDVAHVVYRTNAKVEHLGITRTSVLSLKRHDGEWRALLSGTLEGLARQLANARIQQRQPPAK